MECGKRLRSFTAGEKLKIINEAEVIGNRAAGRIYDVPESCIRDWRKKKEKLTEAPLKKRAFRGKAAKYPQLEVKLTAFIDDKRQYGYAVSTEMCQIEAIKIAKELNININEFKASRGWLQRFFKRSNLSVRRKTTISQRLPEAYTDKLLCFQRYVIQLRKLNNYPLCQIGNADQTPVYFEMPVDTTVNKVGDKTVKIRTAGCEKQRCTVMLTVLADGKKLPPYVILKRKNLPKNESFPPGLIMKAQEKGWMDNELVLDWIKRVWNRRPGALLKRPGMLVMDSFRGHLTDDVKKVLSETKTEQVIIPGGMTSMLQPLDVCINKPFKCQLKKMYTQWMSTAPHELTPTGRLRRPSLTLICSWIIKAWDSIPEDLIKKSFKKTGISNALDGSEDDKLFVSEDEAASASDEDSPFDSSNDE